MSLGADLYVDLRATPYSVVPNDAAKRASNTAGINRAISDFGLAGSSLKQKARLVLPSGEVYIDQANTTDNWSIKFGTGVSDLTLAGQGMFATTLVQDGAGDGGDWNAIVIDGASGIEVCDFGIRQGIIQRPDPGQQNHLVAVFNNQVSGTTKDVYGHDLYFAKALGDQLRFLADASPQVVENVRFSRFIMRGNGSVIQAWTPSTAYLVAAQVVNNNLQYKCVTAGTSAATGGPTGTGTGISDGTAVWDNVIKRVGARSGVSFQRGFRNIEVDHFYVHGVQNSCIDMEPSGSNELSRAHIHHFFIDNSGGSTGSAVSFGGVSSGARATDLRVTDGVVLAGRMNTFSTDDALFENITVISTAAFVSDPTIANVFFRQINNNLTIRNIRIERIGSSGTGAALDIENTGNRTTIDGGYIRQGTPADPVAIDSTTNVRLRSVQIVYEGSSPASRNAIHLHAIGANADSPQIDDVRIISTTGRLQAALYLATRSVHATLDLAPLTANVKTVLRSKAPGTPGNSITLQFVADGTGVGTLSEGAYPAIVFHYQGGVTTVANFESAVTASANLEIIAVDGIVTLTSPGDTFGPTALTGGVERTMTNVRVTNLHAAGSATNGVILSKGLNSVFDVNPMIQSVHNGTDQVWKQVDGNDNPITTLFPIVSGSQGASTARQIEGEVAPNGNVVGNLGDLYTYRPTTTTAEVFVKASQAVAGAPDDTGWVTLGSSGIAFGAQNLRIVATPLFFAPGWITAANATEIKLPVTKACRLRNLRVQVGAAGTGAATITFTVRKNGVDTALTTNISNTATGLVADTTNLVAFAAGDLVSLKVTKSAAVVVGQTFVSASLEAVQ